MSTPDRRKNPPDSFSRPGGYDIIGHTLERSFKLLLEQMPPEEKTNPYTRAGLIATRQHLVESAEHAVPGNSAFDI